MRGPGLARTYSMSIVGIEGHLVDVETYAGSGLVAFTLVGLLDTSVREARDRVRAAFESCGLDVLDQRITVNLSPAGIPKSGSAFDLSIAASIALATCRPWLLKMRCSLVSLRWMGVSSLCAASCRLFWQRVRGACAA